jgi:hypothetical protein
MKISLLPAALILLMSFTGLTANAQLPHASIYAHALYATAIDNSSQLLYNGGAGLVGGILVGKKNTKFNGSIGYTSHFADGSNPAGNETYIPLKAGIRQYIPLTAHFLFIQGDLGVGFLSYENNNDNNSRFAFDFGGGVKLGVFEAALVWDTFEAKHSSGWSSWLTIQAGFNLGF